MWLLDTNVVSELRKVSAGKANRHVAAWADGVEARDLYLSVITLHELEVGVLLTERRDAHQGALLRAWLEDHVVPAFAKRLLPVTDVIARVSAGYHVPNPVPVHDALIAATAAEHRLTLVTRNVRDFERMGVGLFNPWDAH
jgi:hypothetical protein